MLENNDIAIEKGVVLTKEYLDANKELFTKYLNFWILYPDLLLDRIQASADQYFHLFFFQRINNIVPLFSNK